MVYALFYDKTEHGWLVKIGMTSNMKQRLSDLSTARPDDPTHIIVMQEPDKNKSSLIENMLHSYFAHTKNRGDKKLLREWFYITNKEWSHVLSLTNSVLKIYDKPGFKYVKLEDVPNLPIESNNDLQDVN